MDGNESAAKTPVAIIGMACRLPGADTLDEYRDLVLNGRSAIETLPDEVLDQANYYDARPGISGKVSSRIGGTLRNRSFNHNNCCLPEEITASADLTHLIMTEIAADACRHADTDPFNLRCTNTGVYIGHDQGSTARGHRAFASYIPKVCTVLHELPSLASMSGSVRDKLVQQFGDQLMASLPDGVVAPRDLSANMIAGTIHRAFGLTGPCQAVDSACASSLQALLLGVRALQLGRIDMAIVGGASWGRIDNLLEFSRAGAISSTGSRPFDANADGVVCSEGFVSVVLKRLDLALRDVDPVLAVIRGMGVSSDGRGKGLWAPSSSGQMRAIRSAWKHCGDIQQLQYVEAHATSTPIGDLTELKSLVAILKNSLPAGLKIPVSSAKANIGHTLEAAGLAGLIKTVLCMQHRTLPAAINVQRPTSGIDWEQAPLYLPRVSQDWPAPENGHARRAAVNAFGLGGLNAHVVLDDAPCVQETRQIHSHSGTHARVSASSSSGHEAIAVVGCGCVFPDAANSGEWCATAKQAKMTTTDWQFQYDWRRHRIPPKQIERADPLQFLILDAVDQALGDVGLTAGSSELSHVGVLVGAEFGGDFASELQIGLRMPELRTALSGLLTSNTIETDNTAEEEFAIRLQERWPAFLDETGSFHNSSLASRIARTWNITGGAASLTSGPTSVFATLVSGIDMLRTADCDMIICAAGEHFQTQHDFKNPSMVTRTLAVEQPMVGAGCFVLKRLSDAKRDGDRIYRVIDDITFGRAETVSTGAPSPEKIHSVLAGVRSLLDNILINQDVSSGERSGVLTVSGKGLSCQLKFVNSNDSSSTLSDAASQKAPCTESAVSPKASLHRLVQQVRDAPLSDATASAPANFGNVIILGANPVADALENSLTELGATCHRLPMCTDPEQAKDAIDAIWKRGPALQLLVTSAHCDSAAIDANHLAMWAQRRFEGVILPFVVCKHWLARIQEAGLEQQAALAALTGLGGDFGLAGRSTLLEGAAVRGLLNAIQSETDGRLRTLIVDSPQREPAALTAKQLLRELAIEEPEFEVGYVRGRRYVLCALPQSAAAAPTVTEIEAGSVWIVTGRIRPPVTALMCELGTRLGIRFQLICPLSIPEVARNCQPRTDSEWKAIKGEAVRKAGAEGRSIPDAANLIDLQRQIEDAALAFRSADIDVRFHRCDPDDSETLRHIVASIRSTVAPVSGLLHACGEERFGALGGKSAESLSSVLNESIDPAIALMAATRDDPITHVVALCSTEATLNGRLLVDGAIGNRLLAQLLTSYKQSHPACATRVVHCPLWEDSAHPQQSNQRWLCDQLGIRPIPVAEGVKQVAEEISSDTHQTQIVLFDHPGEDQPVPSVLPGMRHWEEDLRRASLVEQTPLIETVHVGTDGTATAYLAFDPRRDPFLSGHRDTSSQPGKSIPMLPGVVSIEACAQAAFLVTGFRNVTQIQNIRFMNGFRMASPCQHRARIRLQIHPDGIDCQFSGDFYDSQGRLTDPDRTYLTCTVLMSDSSQTLPFAQSKAEPAEWSNVYYESPSAIDQQSGINGCRVVDYGAELRCLKQVCFETKCSWGIVEAPVAEQLNGKRSGQLWVTSPAFLDAVLAACGLLLTYVYKVPQLPYAFERIEFGRSPRTGERCIVRGEYLGVENRVYSFDLQVTGEDGETILSCRQFDFIGVGPYDHQTAHPS